VTNNAVIFINIILCAGYLSFVENVHKCYVTCRQSDWRGRCAAPVSQMQAIRL